MVNKILDPDNTQQLVAELPQENQLRRKDDLKRLAFRQRTAYYGMFILSLIVGTVLYRENDLGSNSFYLLMAIAGGIVFNIAHVIQAKWHEKIIALRGKE